MKVIIIGKGPGWKAAPMEGETWGVNDLVLRRPVKLTFEMHPISTAIESRPEEIKEINKLGIPVITSGKHEALPNAIVFPFAEMPSQYFTNSIAYMVAYATYKGATEIDMYGCVMALPNEYAYQKPCIEFWIGYAMGKGVKVTIHGYTTIECFKPFNLYGQKNLPKYE